MYQTRGEKIPQQKKRKFPRRSAKVRDKYCAANGEKIKPFVCSRTKTIRRNFSAEHHNSAKERKTKRDEVFSSFREGKNELWPFRRVSPLEDARRDISGIATERNAGEVAVRKAVRPSLYTPLRYFYTVERTTVDSRKRDI